MNDHFRTKGEYCHLSFAFLIILIRNKKFGTQRSLSNTPYISTVEHGYPKVVRWVNIPRGATHSPVITDDAPEDVQMYIQGDRAVQMIYAGEKAKLSVQLVLTLRSRNMGETLRLALRCI